VIAVPLVLGTLIPSQPLGAEAVAGSISVSAASRTETAFNVPPEERNVLDWLRAFNTGDYAQFEGQPADVIGFVYTEPTFDEDEFMVARFTISCCVADASAIGLPVFWNDTADLKQGDWVNVKGRFGMGEFRGDQLPVLYAASIETVAQPEHPYLYP
jgi:putative membrane protein